MAFKTKLDFSSNRQVKQHEKTITALSGGTSFGLPYSAITSGPDLKTSAITQTIVSITGYTSTFSGNNTTTQYNWFDTRMSLGESMLSAITSTTSAATQVVGGVYTANTNTTIDGNLVNLTYTGVSYSVNPLTVFDLGGGNYSGTVRTYQLDILSASTLDYTGRTIWNDVSGITRTQRLIISDMPVSGYVWTCIDSEGMGEWQYNGSSSGSTIWTAGTGTSSAVLGGSNGIASGTYSVSEGAVTTASGDYGSHAEGMGSIASGQTSHAEGNSTIAGGINSHAQGVASIASGNNSHAEGQDTQASGNNSHAEGWLAKASGATSHAQGYNTTASGDYSHAQGYSTTASGITSHAEGVNTIAGGQDSHAQGTSTQALGYSAHAEGANTIASGQTAHAEGGNTIASGDYSHAGGYESQAVGLYSFVHGYNSVADSQSTVVLGPNITGTSVGTVYVPNIIIDKQDGLYASILSINTSNPSYSIDARGNGNRLYYDNTSLGKLTLSATTGIPTIGVVTNTGVINQIGGITIGVRAWDDGIYTTYGKAGDAHVYSSKQANGLVLISSDGTGTEDYIECYVGGDATSGALAMHMHGTGATKGYVGFNTNLPTERLDVDGNGRFRSIGSSASAGALHYAADGTLTTNTSDERLKTNIISITGALDKVKQLRGVTYNWTENPSGDTRIGFIAQEVNSVVPELTFTNPNSQENYMGVHYDNVTALLVEAVKELSSGVTISNNTHLITQTILAEDNNIELNYSGTPETAIGGGIRILHALGADNAAELITDIDGNFITNNDFKPNILTIPLYTPTSSNDASGSEGNITRDDNYLYIKSSSGWKRTNLESF